MTFPILDFQCGLLNPAENNMQIRRKCLLYNICWIFDFSNTVYSLQVDGNLSLCCFILLFTWGLCFGNMGRIKGGFCVEILAVVYHKDLKQDGWSGWSGMERDGLEYGFRSPQCWEVLCFNFNLDILLLSDIACILVSCGSRWLKV